jgi:iron complex outermembrane recepter protein
VKRRVVRAIVYLLVICGPATPLLAQTGTIRGTIADSSGSGLPNASITVDGTELRATSGTGGQYEIRGVPSGRPTIRVRLIGYQAASTPVSVPPGGEVRQDFTLGRSAVQLAPIDVVVGSRARHTASEELAVPVDVFPAEQL